MNTNSVTKLELFRCEELWSIPRLSIHVQMVNRTGGGVLQEPSSSYVTDPTAHTMTDI